MACHKRQQRREKDEVTGWYPMSYERDSDERPVAVKRLGPVVSQEKRAGRMDSSEDKAALAGGLSFSLL